MHQYGLCQKPSERRPPFSAVSRDPTLIFLWGCSLGQVLSNCENPARNGPISWEIIDLQNTIFLKNRFFRTTFRTFQRAQAAEIFNNDRSLRDLYMVKFSSFYLMSINRYKGRKQPKNWIFANIEGAVETQRLKILGQKFYHKCNLLRCISVQNFSSIGPAVAGISTHLYAQFWIFAIFGVFVKPSQNPKDSIFFKSACVKIHQTPSSITYRKLSKI